MSANMSEKWVSGLSLAMSPNSPAPSSLPCAASACSDTILLNELQDSNTESIDVEPPNTSDSNARGGSTLTAAANSAIQSRRSPIASSETISASDASDSRRFEVGMLPAAAVSATQP